MAVNQTVTLDPGRRLVPANSRPDQHEEAAFFSLPQLVNLEVYVCHGYMASSPEKKTKKTK